MCVFFCFFRRVWRAKYKIVLAHSLAPRRLSVSTAHKTPSDTNKQNKIATLTHTCTTKMRRALSVLAASTAAAVTLTDPVSAFAFNVRAAGTTTVAAVAERRLPSSSSSFVVQNAAPQPRTQCRAASGAVGGTRMAALSSGPSPGGGGSGGVGASRLGEGCRQQRVFDPRSARRRTTTAAAAAGVAGVAKEKGGAAAVGDRVWNTCKERVELGTSGLMVSRVRCLSEWLHFYFVVDVVQRRHGG